ncbi:MAG TPA: cytochrome c biogenesis protein CcsA [Candidatus Akkermansia intestinavium]|nr:cytochrome c biogenesis protein CcsA [Candidatus Akkermansia intestinavium]
MSALIYLLTAGSLLGCLASALLAASRQRRGSRRCFVAGWWLALALLPANAWLAQSLPFGNMRHVLCFFPLVMLPADLLMRRTRGLDLTGCFAAASALMLVGALCMPLQAAWRQMPALQSPWFAPHVTSYVIAYGLMTVAAFLCLLSWRKGRGESDLQAADAVVRLAFPFLTFGLISGAIWADAAWGGYWAWDIKEVWSLLTWCLYLLYFHVQPRATFASWRRPLLLLAFVAIVITFMVVNLLPQIDSMHSYAQ